jgi:hypothetical protein
MLNKDSHFTHDGEPMVARWIHLRKTFEIESTKGVKVEVD